MRLFLLLLAFFSAQFSHAQANCSIADLTVTTVDCHNGQFYAVLNFEYANVGNDGFKVQGNGTVYGTFPYSQVPLTLGPLPANGTTNYEFVVKDVSHPTCGDDFVLGPVSCGTSNPCEIYDFAVETGDCNDDGTYHLWLNFEVQNPGNDFFEVWANGGQYIGIFPIDSLPLHIAHFPTNGGDYDAVKVCINDQPNCCKVKEFLVPDCVGSPGDCHIFDLHGQTTPCLCGQFFVLLSFEYENVGNGGFDVVGNGNNYGTYGYNTQQPIILGPFEGDSTTALEFVVRDHNHPDCQDVVEFDPVDCGPNFSGANEAKSSGDLSISPNPAIENLHVQFQMPGVRVGQASVDIFQADGKLVKTRIVADGSDFSLDISELPAGNYGIKVRGEGGAAEGRFLKN